MSVPAWLPDWRGRPVAVIAAGSSVTREQVDEVRASGCRTIVVNRSYELAPWADVLYAADRAFWAHYAAARAFAGLKVSSDTLLSPDPKTTQFRTAMHALMFANMHDIRAVVVGRKMEISFDGEPLGYGGCSGFQALNIAILTGASPILGLGYDYRGKHWHKDHPMPLNNPLGTSLAAWADCLDKQAKAMKQRGVRVINCSPASLLKAYPVMSVSEALARLARERAA